MSPIHWNVPPSLWPSPQSGGKAGANWGLGRGFAVKRLVLWGLAGGIVGVLAGCQARVPDSGQGVGFNDYAQYELDRAQREAALNGVPATTGSFVGTAPIGTGPIGASSLPATPGAIPSSDLAAAGIGSAPLGAPLNAPLNATGLIVPGSAIPTAPGQPDLNRTTGLQASPGNAAPVLLNHSGISDEQEFAAVSGRESIESNAQRLAQQAAAYEVIQPTAIPQRDGSTGPNIIEYALNAPNAVGQEYYSRFVFSGQGRFRRNCAGYTSPDEAQRDFLSRGGPDRDPRGIDPDGDGFACGWDPAPFRLAVQN